MPKRTTGFTLMELLIVLVVVAILASLAYPSYQEHVRQTRRAEVGALLLENAQLLERHYTRHGRYDSGQVVGLVSQSPASGPALFNIQLERTAETFQLRAIATPGGMMAQDACAHYGLDQLGRRTPTEPKCWRR